jgi:hypothetical protein
MPEHKDLPNLHTEITPGSAVNVTFTLGTYKLSDSAAMNYGVTSGVSLNFQSVILLTDPLKADGSISFSISNASLHLGILSETESSDSEDESENMNNLASTSTDLM